MRQLIILFVVMVIAASAVSCKKGNGDNYTPFLKASVNDSLFYAAGQSLVYTSSAKAGGNTYLYIYAEESLGDVIKMSFIGNPNVGTISFGGTNVSAYYYLYGLSQPYSQAVSGSITITATSPHLEGIFSFTCADGTQVKSGSFSALVP